MIVFETEKLEAQPENETKTLGVQYSRETEKFRAEDERETKRLGTQYDREVGGSALQRNKKVSAQHGIKREVVSLACQRNRKVESSA